MRQYGRGLAKAGANAVGGADGTVALQIYSRETSLDFVLIATARALERQSALRGDALRTDCRRSDEDYAEWRPAIVEILRSMPDRNVGQDINEVLDAIAASWDECEALGQRPSHQLVVDLESFLDVAVDRRDAEARIAPKTPPGP